MTRRWTRRELAAIAGAAALVGVGDASPGSPFIRRHGVVGLASLAADEQGKVDAEEAATAMKSALGWGISHWPSLLIPQAAMAPSTLRPRLWYRPAATATKSALGEGILHW